MSTNDNKLKMTKKIGNVSVLLDSFFQSITWDIFSFFNAFFLCVILIFSDPPPPSICTNLHLEKVMNAFWVQLFMLGVQMFVINNI